MIRFAQLFSNLKMAEPTVSLKIIFEVERPEKTVIETNAKPEVVPEILETWIQSQLGTGADNRAPEIKEVYTILMTLKLRNDSFLVSSDTGNNALTLGIVMDVWNRIADIKITGPKS